MARDRSEPVIYGPGSYLYNSFAHQREGQNVLFNDAHVTFEATANVGTDNDNIWQKWPSPFPTAEDEKKMAKEVGGFFPEYPTATGVNDRAMTLLAVEMMMHC